MQLIEALNYCHSKDVIHHELMTENVFIMEDKVKLIHFGSAKSFDAAEKQSTVPCSALFMAPEICEEGIDTKKCDTWSFGVILYMLLTGKLPFDGRTNEDILSQQRAGDIKFDTPEWEAVSPEGKDLCQKLLNYSANDRLSTTNCLNHDWFENYREKVKNGQDQEGTSPASEQRYKNLKEINKRLSLAKASMAIKRINVMVKANEDDMRELFETMNRNYDNVLTKEELILGFKKRKSNDPEGDAEHLLEVGDVSGDNII